MTELLSIIRRKIGRRKWNYSPIYSSGVFNYHGEDASAVGEYYHIVADGVSGSKKSPSSRVLAQSLVKNVEKFLQNITQCGHVALTCEAFRQMVLSAIQVTLRAWDTYQPISIASTLCVTYFDLKNGIMYTLAIGDTKIIVIREGKVVDESPAVLKGFNIPTVISTKNRLRTHDYVVRSAKIMKGDLCITFSDGLADNVFPDDVLHLVSNAKISHPIQFQNFVNQLAADLIRKAIHEDPSYSKEVHPFALAAAREYQFRMDQLACLEDLQDKEDTSLQLNLVTNRTIFDHRIFVDREQRYSDSQMKQLARVRGIKRDDVSTAVTYFK